MHPWPNHDGSPTAPDDDFPTPPPQIGEVLSATTNCRGGKVHGGSMGFVIALSCGAGFLGWLLGWGLTQAVGEAYALPLQAGLPVVLTIAAFIALKRIDSMPHATFVGRSGFATGTGPAGSVKWKVFEFKSAEKLELTITHQTVNGVPTGDLLKLTWVDAGGRKLHEEQGNVPMAGSTIALPPVAPKFFFDAVIQAWEQHRQRRDLGAA